MVVMMVPVLSAMSDEVCNIMIDRNTLENIKVNGLLNASKTATPCGIVYFDPLGVCSNKRRFI